MPIIGAPSRTRTAIAGLQNRNNSLYTKGAKVEQDIGFEPMTFSLATKHSTTELILHCVAYPQGLEPRPTVLETVMLPLH